jgi:hypothetical protein
MDLPHDLCLDRKKCTLVEVELVCSEFDDEAIGETLCKHFNVLPQLSLNLLYITYTNCQLGQVTAIHIV